MAVVLSVDTSPKRVATRAVWVSTGRTCRPKLYIMTHLAVLTPTPGSEVRYCCTVSSSELTSPARETSPKS